MEETFKRKQFTFYRSFYEATLKLTDKQRLACMDAVIRYALDGTPPPPTLCPAADLIFVLLKPTLDTARQKAIAGAIGGSTSYADDNSDASSAQAE